MKAIESTTYDTLPVEMIDVGHAQMAYRKTGTGPDVVFIHGWPLTGATFRGSVEALAGEFTCHIFDLPGVGDSTVNDLRDVNLAKHSDAMMRAIDILDLDRYALVAHDSGAVIARTIAAAHGDRVRGMVFGNTEVPHHRPWMLQLYVTLAKLPGIGATLPIAIGSKSFRHTKLGFGGCFFDAQQIDGEFHDRFVEPILTSKKAAAGQLALLFTFDWGAVDGLPALHQKLKAPIQLVWGARDPWFPLDKARAMLGELPRGSELQVIDEGKLFVHEEHPKRFAAHAKKFLRPLLAEEANVAPSDLPVATGDVSADSSRGDRQRSYYL